MYETPQRDRVKVSQSQTSPDKKKLPNIAFANVSKDKNMTSELTYDQEIGGDNDIRYDTDIMISNKGSMEKLQSIEKSRQDTKKMEMVSEKIQKMIEQKDQFGIDEYLDKNRDIPIT
jgi:hypothetical protein